MIVNVHVLVFWPPLLQLPDQITSRPLWSDSVMLVPDVKLAVSD